jgi:uncharacterized protein (TIGR02145 family)
LQIGSGSGFFSTKVVGLNPNSTYYVKAYATNSNGVGYGIQYSFNTGQNPNVATVKDGDGNDYHIVPIGSQIWLAENLKTTKYNDGTPIPLVTGNSAWNYLTSAGYCWYNNDDSSFKTIYGALYNWYTVEQGKLCPAGWHVPTVSEWKTLITFLGRDLIAGGKLKEVGTVHWRNPNSGSTNETGFTALPGGYRNNTGSFFGITNSSNWWSTTKNNTNGCSLCEIYYDGSEADAGDVLISKNIGNAVRCVKDN